MTPTSGAAALFRLDPDESIHVVLTGVTVSNGLAWSPDGSTVYYVDSPTQRIDAFDFDAATAAFENQRTVPMLAGRPHEAAGNGSPRWMATGPRKRVHRTRPTGRLARHLTWANVGRRMLARGCSRWGGARCGTAAYGHGEARRHVGMIMMGECWRAA
jgi:sugar lactone lactonase YvrE